MSDFLFTFAMLEIRSCGFSHTEVNGFSDMCKHLANLYCTTTCFMVKFKSTDLRGITK